MLRRTTSLAVAALGIATLALAGSAQAISPKPSLTITNPTAGSSISRSAGSFIANGTTAFTDPAASTTKLYLHYDAPGGTCGEQYMTTTNSADSGNSCQNVIASETLAGVPFSSTYPAHETKAGLPLTIDASRNITGDINVKTNPTGIVNHIQMDVIVQIDDMTMSQSFDSGVYTATSVKTFNLDIDVPPELDKVDASMATVTIVWKRMVHVHVAQHTYLEHDNPATFVSIPTYTASFARAVDLSLGDPTFSFPQAADLDLVGKKWSATIPTNGMSLGSHILYARAIQGGVVSSTRSVAFTMVA